MSQLIRASPVSSSGGRKGSTCTSTPRRSRCRAMTKPSPPLLPLPQQTTTRPAAPSDSNNSAAPRPALKHHVAARGARALTLQFEVADAEAEAARLAGQGVQPTRPLTASPEGYRRVDFAGPEGQPVCLFDWRG